MQIRFLQQFSPSSLEARVIQSWNAGTDLKDAVRFCNQKGITDTHRIVQVWRCLHRQFGCACVPIIDPNQRQYDARSAHHNGLIGPGRVLRELIAGHHSHVTQR